MASTNSSPHGSSDDGTTSSGTEILPSSADSTSSDSGSPSRRSFQNHITKSGQGTRILSKQKRKEKHPHARYSIAYQALLDEFSGNVSCEKPLRESQIGLTIWSANEKELFFQCLSRKGRDDLRDIAQDIGTKSEPEIQAYLHLLEQAIEVQRLHESRPQLLNFPDVPASWEVSKECVAALESLGRASCHREQQRDEIVEKEKYGKLWLLDQESAAFLEESMGSEEESSPNESHQELHRAFELIDLNILLQLSSRIFMNSVEPEGNWRSFASQDQMPCLFASAFVNLYEVTITLLKRLISSAIFFAMSRLRTTKRKKYQPRDHVRAEDVTAALEVLGVRLSSDDFWIGAARRCKLNVFESLKAKKENASRLTYDEVESILQTPRGRCHSTRSPHTKRGALQDDITDSALEDEDSGPDEDTSSSSASKPALRYFIKTPGIDVSTETSETVPVLYSEEVQDAYAETIDLQASKQEERNLWNILKKRPPEEITDVSENRPKRPRTMQKEPQDMISWRSWLNYEPVWESFETPIPATYFARRHPQLEKQSTVTSTERTDSPSQKLPDVSSVEDQTSESDEEMQEELEGSAMELDTSEDLQKQKSKRPEGGTARSEGSSEGS
ncbi:hypothetical protein MMC13_003120 [Lambiella insularis]|nr:hypothetical protein [Lambiella insularis]